MDTSHRPRYLPNGQLICDESNVYLGSKEIVWFVRNYRQYTSIMIPMQSELEVV